MLFMRASVVLALLLVAHGHRHLLPAWAHGLALLVSVALCVGYLTPLAAATALLCHALIWINAGVGSATLAVVIAFDAIALALLGPGAYSIDAYRFGRRLVVLPPQ